MNSWKQKMNEEITLYRLAETNHDHKMAVHHLGRAHILSQLSVFAHLRVHFIMLVFAFKRMDFKEIAGQVLRVFVTIPGHIIGRIPWGNTGWTDVKLTMPLPIPEDLKQYF